MAAILVLDVGLSTGLALSCGALLATDTVGADDLAPYLYDVRDTLAAQDVALDAVLAERPLTLWRSSLAQELTGLCTIVTAIFPAVRWIDASQWKQQQAPLRAYARAHHALAWQSCRSPHERDALLILLWHQGVLAPANSR